jgi:hypothetical protein
MRRSFAVGPALVALTACSLIENFDGYTSGSEGGAPGSDASIDAPFGADSGDASSGDGSHDAALGDVTSGDEGVPADAVATDTSGQTPAAYIYVLGGVVGLGSTPSSDVLSAPAYADGSLGAWSATTSLPVAISTQGTTALNGSIFSFGGTPDGASALTTVYSTQASGGGNVGAWTMQTQLGTNRFGQGAAVTGSRVYAVGGHDSSGALAGTESAAPTGGGVVSGWSADSVLPTARDLGAACIYNGIIYLAAGSDDGAPDGASSIVYAAPIEGDGSLGTWVDTSILMTRRWGATCTIFSARLYVFGGQDSSGNFYGDVQWSPIAGDGSLGSWTQTTGFAPSRFEHATVAIGNRVYVIGGAGSAGLLSDVQVGEIGGDGSIASWTPVTSLPAARALHGAVAF